MLYDKSTMNTLPPKPCVLIRFLCGAVLVFFFSLPAGECEYGRIFFLAIQYKLGCIAWIIMKEKKMHFRHRSYRVAQEDVQCICAIGYSTLL